MLSGIIFIMLLLRGKVLGCSPFLTFSSQKSPSGLVYISSLSLFLDLQYGDTPLHFACSSGREKIVGMLKTAGADVEAKDNVRRGLAHLLPST